MDVSKQCARAPALPAPPRTARPHPRPHSPLTAASQWRRVPVVPHVQRSARTGRAGGRRAKQFVISCDSAPHVGRGLCRTPLLCGWDGNGGLVKRKVEHASSLDSLAAARGCPSVSFLFRAAVYTCAFEKFKPSRFPRECSGTTD